MGNCLKNTKKRKYKDNKGNSSQFHPNFDSKNANDHMMISTNYVATDNGSQLKPPTKIQIIPITKKLFSEFENDFVPEQTSQSIKIGKNRKNDRNLIIKGIYKEESRN